MQRKLELLLTSGGYHHYEVSAHARDGRRCRHNLNYWRFGDYLGIGAGAHAKISDAEGITRLWKLRQPAEYLAKAAGPAVIGGERRLTPAEAGFEFMLNALRLTDGFETGLFHQRTGLPLDSVEPALERAAGKGLIERTAEHVRPTETGRRFLNDLQALFLPEERGN
jgi:oxygen-independent coproporphyrinogen-3 oxidase